MELLLIQFAVMSLLAVYGSCRSANHREIDVNKCSGNLCWDQENYPAQEIMEKLHYENNKNLDTFGDFQALDTGISMSEDSSCNMCKHKLSMQVHPMVIRDNNDIYYVVRTSNYQQNLTVSICESPQVQEKESKCMSSKFAPLGQSMACEQKTTMIKLLVYDPKADEFTHRTVQYNSACTCVIRNDDII